MIADVVKYEQFKKLVRLAEHLLVKAKNSCSEKGRDIVRLLTTQFTTQMARFRSLTAGNLTDALQCSSQEREQILKLYTQLTTHPTRQTLQHLGDGYSSYGYLSLVLCGSVLAGAEKNGGGPVQNNFLGGIVKMCFWLVVIFVIGSFIRNQGNGGNGEVPELPTVKNIKNTESFHKQIGVIENGLAFPIGATVTVDGPPVSEPETHEFYHNGTGTNIKMTVYPAVYELITKVSNMVPNDLQRENPSTYDDGYPQYNFVTFEISVLDREGSPLKLPVSGLVMKRSIGGWSIEDNPTVVLNTLLTRLNQKTADGVPTGGMARKVETLIGEINNVQTPSEVLASIASSHDKGSWEVPLENIEQALKERKEKIAEQDKGKGRGALSLLAIATVLGLGWGFIKSKLEEGKDGAPK